MSRRFPWVRLVVVPAIALVPMFVFAIGCNRSGSGGLNVTPDGDPGPAEEDLDDAPADTATATDAGAPAGDDAGDGADVLDATDAGELSCAQGLDAGCFPYEPGRANAFHPGNCPPTWGDAISLCCIDAGNPGFAWIDCGPYLEFSAFSTDTGCAYYYGKSGGDLVAAICWSYTGREDCLAGPPGFTEPACPSPNSSKTVCMPFEGGPGDGDGAPAD